MSPANRTAKRIFTLSDDALIREQLVTGLGLKTLETMLRVSRERYASTPLYRWSCRPATGAAEASVWRAEVTRVKPLSNVWANKNAALCSGRRSRYGEQLCLIGVAPLISLWRKRIGPPALRSTSRYGFQPSHWLTRLAKRRQLGSLSVAKPALVHQIRAPIRGSFQ